MLRGFCIFFLLPITTRSQDFQLKFLRNDFEKYLYTEVKLRPDHGNLDYMLYDSLEHCQQLVHQNVIHPLSGLRYRTDPKSIENRIFHVEEIILNKGNLNTGTFCSYPVFVLRDTQLGDTLYFKYNSNSIERFPFVVNGVVGDEDEYCHLLEKKKLTFSDGLYVHTPNRGTIENAPVSLHRVTEGTETYFTLHLRTYGTRPHSRVKGASVYLSDGSRIFRNYAPIRFEQTKYGYEYSTSIKLSSEELKLLMNSPVAKHQLYIYSYTVPKKFGHQLMMLSRCLEKL